MIRVAREREPGSRDVSHCGSSGLRLCCLWTKSAVRCDCGGRKEDRTLDWAVVFELSGCDEVELTQQNDSDDDEKNELE